MRKAIIAAIILAAGGGSALTYYFYTRASAAEPTISTIQVSRGSVVQVVQASGTLEAVTTVQVGTQVSGTIKTLHADFNSLVRKGQVVATLDPSLFETQIEQARATLVRLNADLDRLRVQVDSARRTLDRTTQLAARQLVSAADLDTATVNVRLTEAQLKSAEAQVVQAQASLNQNEVSLAHTVIRAPIDGIVVSRNVDVGQTVAASMSAPTLFVIAQDLTRMQANASIDESDVGSVQPGQPVSFTVDAYPGEEFSGQVSQVRLQPAVVQNVVTYTAMIDVPNPDLKLKPGMTANVVVEIARRDGVLRIPSQALRFKPTASVVAALGTVDAGAPAGGMTPGGTIIRMSATETAGSSGIERAVLRTAVERGAIGIGDPALRQAQGRPEPSRGAGSGTRASLDPPATSNGTVWVAVGQRIAQVRVTLGISDGTYVELVSGDLDEQAELVTKVSTTAAAGSSTSSSGRVSSPLLPSGPGPGGPPPR